MAKRNHFHNTQKKHYRSKKFRNPYFQSNQLSLRHLVILSMVGFLGTLSVLVFFFMSSRFSILQIQVNGTKYFSTELFEASLRSYFHKPFLLFFDHRNRFVFNQQELQQTLEQSFAFESMSFKREGQTLQIDLVEKQSQMIWISGEQQSVVDLEGKIIRLLTADEQAVLRGTSTDPDSVDAVRIRALPQFIDRNSIAVSVGSQVLTTQEITNIFLFHKRLAEQHIPMKNTQVDRVAGKWIGIETVEGYQILFDATGDIESQVKRLELILREKVTDVTQLKYIDLRFGDHVYFL